MCIAIVLMLFSSIASGDSFSISRTDHLAHLGLSYIGSDLIYEAVRSDKENFDTGAHMFAAFAMFGIGLVKEFLIDPEPSWGDIQANGIGSFGRIIIKIPLND